MRELIKSPLGVGLQNGAFSGDKGWIVIFFKMNIVRFKNVCTFGG